MTAAEALAYLLETGQARVDSDDRVTVRAPAGLVLLVRCVDGDWAALLPGGDVLDLDAELGELVDELVLRHTVPTPEVITARCEEAPLAC